MAKYFLLCELREEKKQKNERRNKERVSVNAIKIGCCVFLLMNVTEEHFVLFILPDGSANANVNDL